MQRITAILPWIHVTITEQKARTKWQWSWRNEVLAELLDQPLQHKHHHGSFRCPLLKLISLISLSQKPLPRCAEIGTASARCGESHNEHLCAYKSNIWASASENNPLVDENNHRQQRISPNNTDLDPLTVLKRFQLGERNQRSDITVSKIYNEHRAHPAKPPADSLPVDKTRSAETAERHSSKYWME